MNISYIFSFVITILEQFWNNFGTIPVTLIIVIAVLSIITNYSQSKIKIINIVYRALDMSFIYSIFPNQIRQFSVNFKDINMILGKHNNIYTVIKISSKIVNKCNFSDKTIFSFVFKSGKLTIKTINESEIAEGCIYKTGSFDGNRLLVLIPAEVAKTCKLSAGIELKETIKEDSLTLTYDVPRKKRLTAIEKEILKREKELERLKQLQTVWKDRNGKRP